MYCPRCGNQAASDRQRFCSICGLRLDGVSDLLARDGVPANTIYAPQIIGPSPRKHGMRRGWQIMFFSIVMFLPVFGFCSLIRDGFPLLLPATIFLTGLFWVLYYRLFGDDYAPPARQMQIMNPPILQYQYLPPQQQVPISSYRSPIEYPQSVVENTTQTLGNDSTK